MNMILSEETFQRYRSNQGYVYLIHAEGTNRYKIGRSVNPVARFEQLKVQSPYPLRIINSFWTPDAINDEKSFHEQYKKYRRFGEWFELNNYSPEEWSSFDFYSEEEMIEKLKQTIDSLQDDFCFFRNESLHISENVSFVVIKYLLTKNTFPSHRITLTSKSGASLQILLKTKFRAVFYEYIAKINSLKSLQYIYNFGIKLWAESVIETLGNILIYKNQITMDEVELSIRGTIAGFVACLNGDLIV
jgi:hypothetical protein